MAIPTNYNAGPLATQAVGSTTVNQTNMGVLVGAPVIVHLAQGSDLGNAVTASVAAAWTAPCAGFFRHVALFNFAVAATCTFDINNSTKSALVIASQTPTTNTASAVTTFTTAAVAEGDVIQLRVTTSGGAGACKGLQAWLLFIPTADSSSNTFI